MSKYLLVFLIGCTPNSSDIARHMGEHSSCVRGYDHTFLCTKFNKAYICYPESGGGRVYCFEATPAEDL